MSYEEEVEEEVQEYQFLEKIQEELEAEEKADGDTTEEDHWTMSND